MNHIVYENKIREFAEESISDNRDSISIVRDNIGEIQDIIEDKIALMLSQDSTSLQGLTGNGFFGDIPEENDSALVSIALDIDQKRRLLQIKKKLRKYDPLRDQIFTINPGRHRGRNTAPIIEDMRSDLELIRIDPQRYNARTHSYEYGDNTLYFDGFISAALLRHTTSQHKDKTIANAILKGVKLPPITHIKSLPPGNLDIIK